MRQKGHICHKQQRSQLAVFNCKILSWIRSREALRLNCRPLTLPLSLEVLVVGSRALLPWQQVSMWNNSCGTECYGGFGPPPRSPPPNPPVLFMSCPSLSVQRKLSCCTHRLLLHVDEQNTGAPLVTERALWLAGQRQACKCVCPPSQTSYITHELPYETASEPKEKASPCHVALCLHSNSPSVVSSWRTWSLRNT